MRLQAFARTGSRFTIHPFKSLQSRHILPLSLTDYISRFGLELILLTIAFLAVLTNLYLFNHAQVFASNEPSVIFSFIKTHSQVASAFTDTSTSTVLAKTDQFFSRALDQSPSIVLASTQESDTATFHTDPTTIQNDVILKTNPADTQSYARSGLTTYTVASGDSINSIASSFGISPETIMTENKIDQNSILKPGQQLTILPTTGITHILTATDTEAAILKKYKVTEDDLLDANNLESFDDLAIGSELIIPLPNVSAPGSSKPASKFVKNESGQVPLTTSSAPQTFEQSAVSFIWPTYEWLETGHSGQAPDTDDGLKALGQITQGFSSRHTGLDISDSHREPVYAAADGYVEIAGYQSNGYGNTLLINDGNGFKTRYGHATQLYVKAGDFVKQGQLIAEQGNTGRTTGATGIHLHFEILRNGTRVNPLNYVHP